MKKDRKETIEEKLNQIIRLLISIESKMGIYYTTTCPQSQTLSNGYLCTNCGHFVRNGESHVCY